MSPVTRRMHALLARELIAACGGLDEAVRASRLKKSRLSQCQDPKGTGYLPIDVVASLEAYCGQPLYSQALVDARPSALEDDGDLQEEACDVAQEAVGLQALVRGFVASLQQVGDLTPRQRGQLEAEVLQLQRRLFQIVFTAGRAPS